MYKQFDRRTWLAIKILLLLVAAGAGVLIWRQVNLAADTTNLLTNPDFEDNRLSGWQAQTMGEAETAIITATNHPDDSYLALEIPNAEAGGLAGVGQRLTIAPLERYRLTTDYELIDPEQSSAELVVRVSQFDRNGELVKTDEFSDPNPLTRVLADDTGQLVWQSSVYHIVTHWRAATVEIGLGLFGQQAATVAIDDVRLQRQPTWLSKLIHDPVALSALVLVAAILGYVVGWPAGREGYRFIAARRAAASSFVSIWPELGWVTLLYAGLTLILTYPVGWHMMTAVPGVPNWDNLPHVWYLWWGKEAILDLGVWLDQIKLIFNPLDVRHAMLALHPYLPFVSLPFTVLKGALFAYNLAFLLSFSLSGLTGYFLCRYLTRNIGAALVGGLIFAFYPNRVGHALAGHILWMANYFLPLYVLSLLILLERPSPRRAIWHGFVTVLLALANPMDIVHGLIPILLIIGGGKIWQQYKRRAGSAGQLKQAIGLLVSANMLALLIYLPFAWPAITQNKQFLDAGGHDILSADLLAFILPSPYHPLLQKTQQATIASLLGIDELRAMGDAMAYVGLVALALAALALWRRWRAARAWLALTLLCAILAMGSYLKIGNQLQPLALPYLWLSALPLYEWSRTPIRFDATVMLGIAILAAIGLAWLIELKARPSSNSGRSNLGGLRVLVVIIISALILAEYLVVFPFPTETPAISSYYYALAKEPTEGAILEIPPREVERYALYYQTVHQHPIANGGEISRYPAGTAELRRFYHQLLWPWPEQTVFPPLGEQQLRAILVDMNISRIIAQRAEMTGESGRATLDYLPVLFGPPIFEDSQILVYAVPPESGAMLPAWQLMPDQKNWQVVQNGAALRMEQNGNLYIYAAQAGTVALEFQLTASFSSVGISLRLNDRPIEPDEYDRESGRRRFILPLQAGFNYIRLNTQPAQEIEVERLTVADSNL